MSKKKILTITIQPKLLPTLSHDRVTENLGCIIKKFFDQDITDF